MNNSHKFLWHNLFAIFLALCLTNTVVNATSSDALFIESFSNEDGKNIGATIRSRAVNIKVGQLVSQTKRLRSGQTQTSNPQQQITLNLFDDAVVKAQLINNYVNKSGSSTWIGNISGQENSTAIFLVRDNKVYGVIESPLLGNYSIRPATDSSEHIIEQIKSDAVLSGENDYLIPPQEDKTQTTTRSATSNYNDDGSIIDVYVAYDQDASGGSVSADDAQSYAELFIAYTNQAYKNSGINQRVWLVGNVDGYNHSDTDTTSLSADLNAVTDNTITGLHEKRDEYHADLVLFFTPFTSGTCAGLAWLQTRNNDISWQSNGFAVMQACSFGQSVFAHELGHTMGSRHDWYVDNGTTPQTYAHGYVDTANKFRTIMAYNNRCNALSISDGCTRVAHFSNPSVNYNNNTTGVAGGSSSACQESDANPSIECDADNATNFNEKALITANFRDSRITWTGNVSNDWSEAGNWEINSGAPGATTIVNRIPRSYDNVYIPNTASNYPTISTGNVEARGVIIESGATLTMTGGTLNVGWNWSDSGGFTATGGTVKFSSPIDITLDSSSTFNHIEIGDGSDSTTVSLNQNIDINGNLTINTGAKLKAGSYTINIAGNWAEQHTSGFDADSSTVIFDGSSQSVTKVTSTIIFNETFSNADGKTSFSAAYLPDNWVSEKPSGSAGWIAGDGQAVRWNDSSDAWLFTTAKTLSEFNTYQLSFQYKNLQSGKTSSFSIYIGTSQNSAAMTTELTSVTDVTSTTFSTATQDFTVSSSGTYYFGIRSQTSDGSYAVIDDFVVNENSDMRFNNLQVASGETDFNANVKVGNNFEIANGGTANFNSNMINVDGSVTNNGSIKQTKSVANNAMSEFVHITNIAGDTNKYYGVEITPSTGNMESTTVEVKGNQTCDSSVSSGVHRCYIITPTTDQTSSVKLYYSSTESNGNTAVNVNIEDSGSWTPQSSTRGGSGDALWAEGTNITSYGSFALVDSLVDTTPDSFSFSDQTNVAVSTVITSNTITVAGITGAADISITNGEYKIGSGSFTSTAGTVNNGDTVTVQHTSSSSFDTNTDTVVTIGGVSDTFTSTTIAEPEDTTAPTTASFTPADDATNIAIDANIVIQFSEIVNVNSGNILIKLTSDDSVFATIPVTDAQVTGTGTNTITINPTNDLNYGTEYYVEIETGAFRDAANNDFAGINDNSTWNFTTLDTTPLTFASTYPKIENITQTTADLKVQINEDGKAYYVVLADGATAPTDVKADANKVTIDLTADTEASSSITDLNAETAYDIYVIAEDAVGNIATAATYPIDLLTQAAADTTAPTFASNYPKIENITQTTAELKIQINENGKAYYVVLADGATAPTDVKADANKVTIDLTANTEATSTITGLSAETAYDIYLIVEDAAGNITQAATYPIDLLTQAAADTTAPTFASSYPKIENITQTTADLKIQINENGKAYYVVLADGATAPTDVKTDANKITIDLTADTEASSSITGLSAETAYDIYLIIEDAAGNITQATTYPINLLTTSSPSGPTPVNIAPTISGNPATVVKVGYNYTFTPTASDENRDSLTFSITNKPDWATFDTNTGTLSGTPNVVSNYTGIEISVSDGQLSAQLAAFNIEVQADNRSPTISGNPKTQIDVGQNYEFIPTTSDPDGDSLTFSIKNKPDWAQFDTATGKLSGQPSQIGTSSNIEISVTDGNATASLRPFNITVNATEALFKPSQLIVTAAVGGVNPASQKLRVNYPNGYNRNKLWSYVTVNASFAKITSALTSSLWIEWNISFKTKKLAIGQHNGTITIKTDDGNKTVPIIINILDTAELQLSRSQLNFGGVQGGKTPKKQKIKVSSSGSKVLNWSTTTNADWLTIEPSQGTTTSNVKVGINASQLANAGEHSATISFIESESGATIDVPITLDVVAANSEEVKLTALEVVQVIQDLNNSIPLIAEKPTFVRAHVSSTTGKRVNNVNAKLTGKNSDTVVFEISPSNDGGSINVSDNPNRSKINDSFLFELPKEYSTGNLTLEFAGVDKPFACADTGNDCIETVSFEIQPAIDMKLVDIIWLRKEIEPTQQMRQAIPENIYNIYPISTLNVTQSNTPFILNSRNSLRLLRTTIRGLFLRKYFDGSAAKNQYYYGVGGKFYGTVGISFRPGTLAAGAYIKGIDRRNFGHNLKLAYRSDTPCGQTVSGSTFSNVISPVTTGPNAIYGFNAKTKRIYPATTSDFMTKRTNSWISDYNYKCAIETLKARTRSARSARSLRSSLINTGDKTVTINGRITGTNTGVIDNLVNAVATTTADAPDAGDYKMSLQTSDGTELAAYPFGPINMNVGGDDDASSASSESAYSLILPRLDNMKRIVLFDKTGNKLDERIASANAPTVNLTTPNGGETIKNDAEKLSITWEANDADEDILTYAIDYSLDAGNNWQTLVTGYDQKRIEIDVALLAGTSQAKFRVTADDSFNSGSDESDAVFTVEGKNPEVSITSPNNGDLFITGQTINFVGQAYDKEDGKLTGTSLTWSSDRDGDLITTSKLAEDLAEGTHTITLTATDSQNQTSTSTISINVYRERPTSLPATFSVSEDNFTIGGYVNGGTVSADLTISNGGDGSLTWNAASDANWLTFSETTGTAPSNIKLIANPAELEVGVYSGNVILTSDIPGVIAKTIEVTFRVQEVLPIASTPVQQVDNSGTNKVDNIIDGGTIPKDKTITGATLRGKVINEGTLKDINFEGEELKGGTLAGKIANKGIIIDVTLSENTEIQGGSLRGNIVGAANASLDNLEIVDNSQLTNVSFGQNVTFGTGVTLKDVKFMGASISNCKLEGTIRTASSATTIKDVVLGAKAKVIGGKLAGTIKGDSSDRALLQHLTIEPNSQLSEVILGDGVDIETGVYLGSNVQFSKVENIPFNIDLTQTLAKINSVVDLSADLVQGGKGLLVTINALPTFTANKIDQSDKDGNLTLKVDDLSFAVTPVKVKRVDSKDQSVRLGFGNSVYFKTDDGIEVETYPAVQDLATLKTLLAAIELPKINISKEGNIQIPVTDKLWLSGRAELASKPSEEQIIGFKLKGDLVVLVFEKDGQKREQVLYPAPASALNEEASLTEQGILSFRTYKGRLDYSVENGEAIESLTITEITDSNGDFLITYPEGYKQKIFALPAAE
jgi:hypothetical protein